MPAETAVPQPEQKMTREQMAAAWSAEAAARRDPDAAKATQDAVSGGDAANAAEGQGTAAAADTQNAAGSEPAPQETFEERFARMEAENQTLRQEVQRQSGRTSALQKKLDAGVLAAKTAEAPSAAQQQQAVEDPAEWKKLLEDFPEWGLAVQKKLDVTLTRAMSAHPKQDALAPDAINEIVTKGIMAREFARVDRIHPDWRDTVNTPEFAAWQKSQKPEVQALFDSDYSADAIAMLDRFKSDRAAASKADQAAALAAKRKQNLQVSANDQTGVRQAPQAGDEPTDKQGLWEQEKQLRAAKRRAA